MSTDLPEFTGAAASISDDGLYRYDLYRSWRDGPCMTFVMLNPSTADAEKIDPTLRQCVNLANRHEYGTVHLVNLFAYRSSDPQQLTRLVDPVGPDNDGYLHSFLRTAADWPGDYTVVVAWGSSRVAAARVRAALVRRWAFELGVVLHSFGQTKNGSPRHPARLALDTPLEIWP